MSGGHEMPIHHIKVDPVGTGAVDGSNSSVSRPKSEARIEGAMMMSCAMMASKPISVDRCWLSAPEVQNSTARQFCVAGNKWVDKP